MKKALISSYNKDKDLLDFVRFLSKKKYKIISTGGTYKYFKQSGGISPIINISDITSFKEILDGKIKSIHPNIYCGILTNRNLKKEIEFIKKNKIDLIDIVLINCYPFIKKINELNNNVNLNYNFLTKFIDIGGPSIIRAAAKNFFYVTPIIDKKDYKLVINEIDTYGFTTINLRKKLAGKVFNFTSFYDSIISNFFLKNEKFPVYFNFSYEKKMNLRYGENPHQKASFYINSINKGSMSNCTKLHGKDLSFNNFKDIDVAWKIVNQFNKPCCCIVKHSIPCGVALGNNIDEAFEKTYSSDTISSFGGVIAMNRSISKKVAEKINKIFLEVIVTKNYDNEILQILNKKKNIRIIRINNNVSDKMEYVQVDGGMLVQESNLFLNNNDQYKIVTKKKFSYKEIKSLLFAQNVVKHVKSNAIVVAKEEQTLGISGGETNRIWAAKQAINRAIKAIKKNKTGLVLVSDAFLPFRDVVDEAAKSGKISAILQPGGSIRDKESIIACDYYGISMAFTGKRYFKH